MNNSRKPRGTAAMNGTQPDKSQRADRNTETEEPLAFEEALGRLDETVAALESGQLPLEEALQLYEEGVRVAQRCQEMLDSAALRVQRLRVDTSSDDEQASGNVYVLEAFELDEE